MVKVLLAVFVLYCGHVGCRPEWREWRPPKVLYLNPLRVAPEGWSSEAGPGDYRYVLDETYRPAVRR